MTVSKTSPMKYLDVVTVAIIETKIKGVKKTSQTLRNQAQICAVAIVEHTVKTGDWTKANDLVDALGKGVNQKAMVEFFVQTLGLVVDEENKCFGSRDKKHTIKVADAKALMWFDLKQSNPFAGFDLNEELIKLLKKAEKAGKLTGDDADKVIINAETLTKLRALQTK